MAATAFDRALAVGWPTGGVSRRAPATLRVCYGRESVIRFGIKSAPKGCSLQAEFHHILSRRSALK
jgi:hypothetical protein